MSIEPVDYYNDKNPDVASSRATSDVFTAPKPDPSEIFWEYQEQGEDISRLEARITDLKDKRKATLLRLKDALDGKKKFKVGGKCYTIAVGVGRNGNGVTLRCPSEPEGVPELD